MSILRQLDQVNVVTAQTITSTTETIVVTGPNLSIPKDTWFAVVLFQIQLTVGTGQTSCTIRVRKGTTLTGTVLGNPQALTVTAAALNLFSGFEVDSGSFSASTQYVLTVQFAGGAGNSTVNEAMILTMEF